MLTEQIRQTLRDDVLAELDLEPRVESSRIGVAVKEDGTVTLTGTVATLSEKWAAEEAVQRVKGVKAIANDISVDVLAEHQRSDTDIASAISQAFAWDTTLPNDLCVLVENGYVTLQGEVDWQYQRQNAERIARQTTGVRGVSNALSLRSAIAPADVRRELQRVFHRDAQIDADNIQIVAEGGKVTLRGRVHGWFERNEATRAAWSIKGVSSVENQIAIV